MRKIFRNNNIIILWGTADEELARIEVRIGKNRGQESGARIGDKNRDKNRDKN